MDTGSHIPYRPLTCEPEEEVKNISDLHTSRLKNGICSKATCMRYALCEIHRIPPPPPPTDYVRVREGYQILDEFPIVPVK